MRKRVFTEDAAEALAVSFWAGGKGGISELAIAHAVTNVDGSNATVENPGLALISPTD